MRARGALETETFADLLGLRRIRLKKTMEYSGFGSFPKFPMFEALN